MRIAQRRLTNLIDIRRRGISGGQVIRESLESASNGATDDVLQTSPGT